MNFSNSRTGDSCDFRPFSPLCAHRLVVRRRDAGRFDQAGLAQAQLIVLKQDPAITYLNGGVGEDEAQSMRKVAKDWPLRLTFSESKGNQFVADVGLLVTDLRGTPYLQLTAAGPTTYVRLPAGKYRVTARFQGESATREVTLDGKDGRDVNFHWAAPAQ